MKVLDLFSGIGGFSLGLERAGMETVAFCEIDPFCQKVLAKHWPGVLIYDDVREVTAERLRADGIFPDIITGGFPCQDISAAGKQEGITAERSGLWSELARIIGDVQPRYAIVENVTALISGNRGRWFGRVLGDLAEIGYDAEWHCVPASAVGAHHRRDRVWIIAYSVCGRQGYAQAINPPTLDEKRNAASFKQGRETVAGEAGRNDPLANTTSQRQQGPRQPSPRLFAAPTGEGKAAHAFSGVQRSAWLSEPDVGRVAHGVPRRVDRLRSLGNAVVPQIPELIGRAIMEIEK